METKPISQIIDELGYKEKIAKRRAVLFTFVPTLFAIILISYTTKKVLKAQKELQTVEHKIQIANERITDAEKKLDSVATVNKTLIIQNEALKESIVETTILLGKQVSVFSEIKEFIDHMKTYDRSYEQAAFWINFRMLDDRIRGNYEDLSKEVSELPNLDPKKDWIVIVQSSTSLDDLKLEVGPLTEIYGREQIAIYKTSDNYYSLAVKGNGTFTRAYRLNVELRDKYNYNGPYFSGKQDWGRNYLL